ncbi:MAG: TRAP transporter small permease [Planctomycetota bacterium]|jgi:TRAP-type C4-dicarboxylate transport system permease small subunit|nr:TRAP transporter small permease [Planctomycetota bacterium]
MAVMRWLDKNFEYVLLAALLAVLTVFSFLNVILRYGFNSSIVWSDEVCRYSLVLSGFFSIPCWLRHKTGLRVDAFLPLFPEKLRIIFDWGASLLMLALFSYLTYGIWLVTRHSLRINLLSPTLRFPLAYLYGVIALAFVLSCTRLLQALAQQIRRGTAASGDAAVEGGGQ